MSHLNYILYGLICAEEHTILETVSWPRRQNGKQEMDRNDMIPQQPNSILKMKTCFSTVLRAK